MHVQLSLFMVWQIKIDGDAYLNTLLVSSYFVQCTFCLLIPSIELELGGVLSNANDINLFLMIFPYTNLHCKLVPIQYRVYDYGLSQ